MKWEPIEDYDKLKKKPRHAVFLFSGETPKNGKQGAAYYLVQCVNTSRSMGFRTCTHWMPLPEPPNKD